MGTKNNPGKWDCYAKAEPDEPVFVLLGRDPMGARAVQQWANDREWALANGAVPEADRQKEVEKIAEARECAAAMETYHNNLIVGAGGVPAQQGSDANGT